MLQIQPDKDIVIEFIKQEDYKYLYIWYYVLDMQEHWVHFIYDL